MFSSASKNLQRKAEKISIWEIFNNAEISLKDEYEVVLKRYKELQEELPKATDGEQLKKLRKGITEAQARITAIKLEDENIKKSGSYTDPNIILAAAKSIIPKNQWGVILAEARMLKTHRENEKLLRIKRAKKSRLSQSHEELSYQEKKDQNLIIDSFLNGFANP